MCKEENSSQGHFDALFSLLVLLSVELANEEVVVDLVRLALALQVHHAWPRAASQLCPGLALLDLRVGFLKGRFKRVACLSSFWNWSASIHGAALPKSGQIEGQEVGCGGLFVRLTTILPLVLSPQDLAADEALPVYNRCAIHALSAAYLNLICQLTTVPTFCQHVHEV